MIRTPIAVTLALTLLASTATAAARADRARSRAVELERLYRTEGPSLALSTVYHSLPAEQRHALLGKLRAMLLAQLPPGIEDHPALDQLPPAARMQMKQVLFFLKALTPAQLDAFVAEQDLDHLLPLPTEVFQLYHQKSMADPVPGGDRRRIELAIGDRADPESWRADARAAPGYVNSQDPALGELVLLKDGDPVPDEEVPTRVVKPALGGMGVEVSTPVELPAHALVNSARLARALNHLTNPAFRERPLTVRAAGKRARVRSGVELLNTLLATKAYEVAVHDARMFVDFLGLSVPHGDGYVPVRMPTWFATGVDSLIVPGNHSEHVLVLYRRGTRRPEALVKWYMGIPSAGPSQGTLFKPAVWRRTSWCHYRVVRTYPGPASARMFLEGAGELMRLFNFLQARYQLPKNGYGVLGVCNDTTGLMEAILQGQTGRSTVWPLIRDPGLDFYYAGRAERLRLRMKKGAEGARVLDVPSDARPDHYPWVKDRRVLLYRIGANIPTRDVGELHFPGLGDTLEALRTSSAYFARGLETLSTRAP